MFITTKFTISMITGEILEHLGYNYEGPVALACGASDQQKKDASNLSANATQIQQEAQQVFGKSSSVYTDLYNAYAPIVAAGPDQQGFTPQELAARNSEVINTVGTQYANAKAAVGNAIASQTGAGGASALPSGATIGLDTGIATGAASTASSEFNEITKENYATGRQNFDRAAAGLAAAPGVFSTATGAEEAGTNAGKAASDAEAQVTAQNQSWMQAVSGALGDVATVGSKALFGTGGSENQQS